MAYTAIVVCASTNLLFTCLGATYCGWTVKCDKNCNDCLLLTSEPQFVNFAGLPDHGRVGCVCVRWSIGQPVDVWVHFFCNLIQRMLNKLGRQGALSLLPVLLVMWWMRERYAHLFIVPQQMSTKKQFWEITELRLILLFICLVLLVNASCHCVSR